MEARKLEYMEIGKTVSSLATNSYGSLGKGDRNRENSPVTDDSKLWVTIRYHEKNEPMNHGDKFATSAPEVTVDSYFSTDKKS